MRKGFTLIELLVVIAVIAVLRGLLMPVLLRAKEMGKRMVWSQEAWDEGTPGMSSTFKHYPPSGVEQSRLPTP